MDQTSSLQSHVRATLAAAGISAENTLIVAVSGGADSLALLHALNHVHPAEKLIVAHLNHGLRSAATNDADFVHKTANAWGMRCIVEQADVQAQARREKQTIEEAARHARYTFLARVAATESAEYVAVGHHADDQAETILMHIVRGSGLEGLRGMQTIGAWPQPDQPNLQLLRPLLPVSRAEIEQYCRINGLDPVVDTTNSDTTLLRNRVRHVLLPELETYNRKIRDRLTGLADVVSAELDLLTDLENQAWTETARIYENHVTLEQSVWDMQPVALQRRLLRRAIRVLKPDVGDIPLRPIEQARELATNGETGKQADLPGNLVLHVSYRELWIEPRGSTPHHIAPQLIDTKRQRLTIPGEIELVDGWILSANVLTEWEHASITGNEDKWRVCAQMALDSELWVRTHHAGERVQPLGMNGRSRKIQDMLTDAKIPAEVRRLWPIVATEAHIVWLPGVRLDQRVAVSAKTPAGTPLVEFHCRQRTPSMQHSA